MAQLYLRKVIVKIVPSSGETRTITDLRIKFKCKKTQESKPNTMEIEIYNLSEASRKALEGKDTSIVLEAGYEETVETIFTGNITKVVHKQEKTDILSKLEVADGGNRYRNAKISKGFPPGVKVQQAIDELISSMGLTRGAVLGIPNTQYAHGLSLSGLAKDRLDDLCKKHDLQWSIQNGAIQIVPQNKTTLDQVIVLSPDSGLIDIPNKTKKGVEFKSLLQPQLIPGKRVQLESRFLKGIFKLGHVRHSGDSHTGEFFSECEAVAV